MKYSFFVISLLLFLVVDAAPQTSSVCRSVPQNPAAGQIAAQYLQIPGCDDSSEGKSGPVEDSSSNDDSTSDDETCSDGDSDSDNDSGNTGANVTQPKSHTASDSISNATSVTLVKPQRSSTGAAASPSGGETQQPSNNGTAPGSGGGKCPSGFRNTVFNTGAPGNAGWPETTWNSLTANGVTDWGESAAFMTCYKWNNL